MREGIIVPRAALTAASLLLWALAARGQELRSHAAHVHGQAGLDLAFDGELLEITLTSPGMNLVGFEGEPGTAGDAERVMTARSVLADPTRLFAAQPSGSCVAEGAAEVVVPAEALIAPDTGAKREAQHDHRHAHEHAPAHDGHSDWTANWRWRCRTAPTAIEVKLFEAFEGFASIEAQVVAPDFQTGVVLRKDASRIELTPAP
jgi:hypothetical protein